MADVKTMTSHVARLKLEPFANMLDAGCATAEAYHLPRNCNFKLVVIDGAGKIAYRAGSEFSYQARPDIHIDQIEKSRKEYPVGILGADVAVPPGMGKAAHLFDLQQFGLLEQELTRVLQESGSAENIRFAELLRGRQADGLRSRSRQIQSMADGQPVQAYREALLFVEAFPKCEEAATLSALADKLIANPKVKLETDAEAAFQRDLLPLLIKAKNAGDLNFSTPIFENYLKEFGATDYLTVAKKAVADRVSILNLMETEAGPTPPLKERRAGGGL
jgi:hypothetical protein